MKATINLSSGFFNKNQKTIQELYNSYDENEYNQVGTYFMEIGELEKVVNLDEFEKAYWRNDTAQEHPVYYKVYDRDNKFDLKGMKLSPIAMEHSSTYQVVAGKISEGESFNIGRGIKDNGEYYNTQADNIYYDTYGTNTVQNLFPDYYGQRICPTYSSNAYRLALVDTIDTCVGQIKPLQSTFANYFTNADVVGLKAYYDTVREKVIAPANIVRTLSMTTDPVGNNRTVAYASDYTTPLMAFNTLLNYQTRNEQGPDGYITYSYYKRGFFQTMSFMTKDNTWTDDFRWCSFGLNGTDLFYTTSSNSPALKTPPIFLRDKNGDYWMMMLSPIETYATYTSEHKTGGAFTPVISLVNIKDFPYLSYDKNARVASTDVSEYVITALDNDIDFLRQRLDWVFSPQSGPSYDDGGADIVGEGEDPYEDISNIDGVVGGKPNTTIVIEQDEGTFNTGGSLFRQLSSAYGAYAFSDGNGLYQYTRTLKLIYDDWMDPLYDPLIKSFADRISNNTINILRLPYKVRLSDDANPETTRTIYAIGNTGIATNNATFLEWAAGTGFATADLITQEIHTATVDLGIIEHFYDNFLDFAPYSSASLYIPYIGTVSIPINLIQSTSDKQKHLRLLFRINNTTGDMIVLLQVDGATYKQWSGNCATPIQIHVDDFSGIMREGFNQAVGIVGNVATGMISAGTSIGGAINKSVSKLTRQSQVNKAIAHINAQHEGLIDPYQTPDSAYNKQTKTATTSNMPQKSAPSSFSTSSIPTIPNSSPVVGSVSIGNSPVSGTVGTLSPQEIILTIERPIMWRPDKYGEIVGYPTKKIAKLGSIKGFATVSNLHLRCSATSAEKSEIEEMLGAGVIF